MIAAKDRFIQLKFIHRAYYTPHSMANINPNLDPTCPRCNTEVGTFWHMVWASPQIMTYWENIAGKLSELAGTRAPTEPMVLLLSYLGEVEGDRYTKLCITFSLFYARRGIMVHQKSANPTTLKSWQKEVESAFALYKLTYQSRQCLAKFDKVWSAWVDAHGWGGRRRGTK